MIRPTLFDHISRMQPSAQREVLALRFGYPLGNTLSIADTARILGIATGKARSLIFSGLGNVRFQNDHAEIDILFQDKYILIVNKPPRLRVPCQNRYSGGSLLSRVVGYLSLRAEVCDVQPAHRLDTDTSGVMVFAKSGEVRGYFVRQFASQLVQKQYITICRGLFDSSRTVERGGMLRPGACFNVDAPIDMRPDFDFYLHEHVVSENGKHAFTRIEVLDVKTMADGQSAVVARIYPLTGRTHQIRVHMAHIGLPVLYDKVYGHGGIARSAFGKGSSKSFESRGCTVDPQSRARALPHERRLSLHAESLQFIHPITKQKVFVKAPLPVDFLDTLADAMLTVDGSGRCDTIAKTSLGADSHLFQ